MLPTPQKATINTDTILQSLYLSLNNSCINFTAFLKVLILIPTSRGGKEEKTWERGWHVPPSGKTISDNQLLGFPLPVTFMFTI